MCRVSLVIGELASDDGIAQEIATLQKYGGNLSSEIYRIEDVCIILNRFDVTSSSFLQGDFPLQDNRFTIAYNGEVYAFREKTFNSSDYLSDVHFSLDMIRLYGVEAFFREADLEGTFIVHDREEKLVYVFCDQLNTKGCFYTTIDSSLVVSQEYPIVHRILILNNADENHPILTLPRGNCLIIDGETNVKRLEFKPDFNQIWKGQKHHDENGLVNELLAAMTEAITIRIPKEGTFGVLCSGGVDSSLVLKIVIDRLKKKNELQRLKIFTLGTTPKLSLGEEDDLGHVLELLNYLNIDSNAHLQIIQINEDHREFLFRTEVFCKNPRLVPPNPALTQVRHTVGMACVLAQLGMLYPEIKVVLTGDFADEIFAGYNSMHSGDPLTLPNIIQDKLSDLFLNDAARVTLASLRGCKLLQEYASISSKCEANNIRKKHFPTPIEIRTPYASPILAKMLKSVSPENLLGKYSGVLHSKFLLRKCAMQVGVPENICWRKKIPFMEGGTGVKNAVPDDFEVSKAIDYLENHQEFVDTKLSQQFMRKLGFQYSLPLSTVQRALIQSGLNSGLLSLLSGNSFRESMPDSNYSSQGTMEEIYNRVNN